MIDGLIAFALLGLVFLTPIAFMVFMMMGENQNYHNEWRNRDRYD